MIYKIESGVQQKLIASLLLVSLTLLASTLTGALLSVLVYARVSEEASEQQVAAEILFYQHREETGVVAGSSHAAPTTQQNKTRQTQNSDELRIANCSIALPKHAGLSSAKSPQLKKLAEYEDICNGAVMARSSFFVPTPTTEVQAIQFAGDVAAKLKEYSKFNIKPLVIMEPTSNGSIISLNKYRSGSYDTALDKYFGSLKQQGITDSMMGMWVVFPEGNIPVWNNVDPATFTANVTKTVQFQKKYFPNSKASILLDSQTYPSGSSWSGGSYRSLLPYLDGIPRGLIDSFGLQGFPWSPPAGQDGALLDPNIYLQVNLAAEAARKLGVTDVWLNTGTFGRAYASTANEVKVSALKRQVMLDGVIVQANKLKAQGFNASVHLFAENKAATPEGIDWSYLSENKPKAVFKTFAHDTAVNDLGLWLFDY
jgi:hypothetical protein